MDMYLNYHNYANWRINLEFNAKKANVSEWLTLNKQKQKKLKQSKNVDGLEIAKSILFRSIHEKDVSIIDSKFKYPFRMVEYLKTTYYSSHSAHSNRDYIIESIQKFRWNTKDPNAELERFILLVAEQMATNGPISDLDMVLYFLQWPKGQFKTEIQSVYCEVDNLTQAMYRLRKIMRIAQAKQAAVSEVNKQRQKVEKVCSICESTMHVDKNCPDKEEEWQPELEKQAMNNVVRPRTRKHALEEQESDVELKRLRVVPTDPRLKANRQTEVNTHQQSQINNTHQQSQIANAHQLQFQIDNENQQQTLKDNAHRQEISQAMLLKMKALEQVSQEQARKEQIRQENERQNKLNWEQEELLKLKQVRLEEDRERRRLWEHERLEQAKLEQAKLEQAHLEQAKLEQAKFERAKLEQAKLEHAKLEQAKQEQRTLDQTRHERARLEQARLNQVRREEERQKQLKWEQERLQLEHEKLRHTNMKKNNQEQVERKYGHLIQHELLSNHSLQVKEEPVINNVQVKQERLHEKMGQVEGPCLQDKQGRTHNNSINNLLNAETICTKNDGPAHANESTPFAPAKKFNMAEILNAETRKASPLHEARAEKNTSMDHLLDADTKANPSSVEVHRRPFRRFTPSLPQMSRPTSKYGPSMPRETRHASQRPVRPSHYEPSQERRMDSHHPSIPSLATLSYYEPSKSKESHFASKYGPPMPLDIRSKRQYPVQEPIPARPQATTTPNPIVSKPTPTIPPASTIAPTSAISPSTKSIDQVLETPIVENMKCRKCCYIVSTTAPHHISVRPLNNFIPQDGRLCTSSDDIPTRGFGSHHIEFALSGRKFKLRDCLYAPTCPVSIFSVQAAREYGYETTFTANNHCEISRNGVVVANAILNNGFYSINVNCKHHKSQPNHAHRKCRSSSFNTINPQQVSFHRYESK